MYLWVMSEHFHITAHYCKGIPDQEKDSTELAYSASLNNRQQHLAERIRAHMGSDPLTAEEMRRFVGVIYTGEKPWELASDLWVLERSGDVRLAGFLLVESSDPEFPIRNTTVLPMVREGGVEWTELTVTGETKAGGQPFGGLSYRQARGFFDSWRS